MHAITESVELAQRIEKLTHDNQDEFELLVGSEAAQELYHKTQMVARELEEAKAMASGYKTKSDLPNNNFVWAPENTQLLRQHHGNIAFETASDCYDGDQFYSLISNGVDAYLGYNMFFNDDKVAFERTVLTYNISSYSDFAERHHLPYRKEKEQAFGDLKLATFRAKILITQSPTFILNISDLEKELRYGLANEAFLQAGEAIVNEEENINKTSDLIAAATSFLSDGLNALDQSEEDENRVQVQHKIIHRYALGV